MADAPMNIEAIRRDLGRALSLIDKRGPEYRKALEYYEGRRNEIGGSAVARAIIAQGKETPISFAHIPVDVIVDKIELTSITAAAGVGKSAIETWYSKNDLDDEAEDWVRMAGVFGDYYVVTDPTGLDDDGRFTVEDIDSIGMSPLSTVVVYDKKTHRIAQFGVHFWDTGTADKPEVKAVLYYDDCSIKLVTVGGKGSDPANYTLDYPDFGEPDDAILEHDGGHMLIHHLAIGGRPYGVPLHRRAWAFQDAIAKVSANNLVNVDAQGLPSRWALLDPAAETDDDVDDDFGTDGPDTKPGSKDGQTGATATTRVRSVPGAIALLRGVKDVGTFDQGDASGFLGNLDWYVRGMAVACGVPLFEFDMNGEQPSGESRRRAEGRSNRKASSVRRQAGAFFRSIAETVLGVIGASGDVVVTFAPGETSTDKEGLELVSAKVKAGVPLRQALLEAGYTDAQVDEWYPADAPALSPEIVAILATALAQLGNAKTLGVLSDADLVAMLPDILSGLPAEGEPVPLDEDGDLLADVVTDPATQMLASANALGMFIRAGVDQEQAAARVGLAGLTFPNLPTTIRVPERDSVGIEEK